MRYALLLVLSCLVLLAGCGDVSLGEMRSALRRTVDAEPDSTLVVFYDAREYAPIWTQQQDLSPDADSLLAYLCRSEAEALDPSDYALETLAALYEQAYHQPSPSDSARADVLAQLEKRLSESFLQYGQDLVGGRIKPEDVNRNWRGHSNLLDAPAALRHVATSTLAEAIPTPPSRYVALRTAHARYRALAAQEGWPTILVIPVPGSDTEAVSLLRQRLAATGDLAAAGTGPYDADVEAAVARFQTRHGLPPTGQVDAETLQALNVSAEARARQVALNLEKLRWLPTELGKAYVLVNLAAHRLYAYEEGKRVLDMTAAGGDAGETLPLLADTVAYVVFSPDSATFSSSLQGSSSPPAGAGAFSAGGAAFIFPNASGTYLYGLVDAPLPQDDPPSLPPGGIQVGDPQALARFALASTTGWDDTRISRAITRENEQRVALSRLLSIYLTYLTAWADEDGTVHFRPDLYGHDARLASRMRTQAGAQTRAACEALTRQP